MTRLARRIARAIAPLPVYTAIVATLTLLAALFQLLMGGS